MRDLLDVQARHRAARARRRTGRALLVTGAVCSLAFIGVSVVSRTVGLPVGPQAFQPEGYGVADLVCGWSCPASRWRSLPAPGWPSRLPRTSTAASPAPNGGSERRRRQHNKADDGIEAYVACKLIHENDNHKGYVSPKL